jgi:hypothetical protein
MHESKDAVYWKDKRKQYVGKADLSAQSFCWVSMSAKKESQLMYGQTHTYITSSMFCRMFDSFRNFASMKNFMYHL